MKSKGEASRTTKKEAEAEVKVEDAEKGLKWYQRDNEEEDDDHKWDYLEHHGVTFPERYLKQGFTVRHAGSVLPLNEQQEELAFYWCQTLGSDWQKNQYYAKNFWNQFLNQFSTKYDPAKFDFSEMQKQMLLNKEARKNDDSDKARRKKEKEENDKIYGYALVDGMRQKVSGYAIEGSTLFKGRGKHKKAGLLKRRVQPQEITINIAESAPVPICPLPGHSWGQIVHKHDTTWLCGYKDGVKGAHKYIFLAANSKFKGVNDRRKYEKARRLKKHIDVIRAGYRSLFSHAEEQQRQIGTAVYLIDFLALRVGNEKSEDEADTQGCCSLRVEHIRLDGNDTITLDFLGKDSIQYVNTIKVLPEAYRNLERFVLNKRPADNLFHLIDTQILNDYLKNLVPGLGITAKVFRTFNASTTLQKELAKGKLSNMSMEEKVQFYNEANKQVAILCNHQKAVSKNFDQKLEKSSQELDVLEKYISQLWEHRKALSKGKSTFKEHVVKLDDKKELVKKYPDSVEGTQKTIGKLSQKLDKEREKLKKREQNKQISLGTSKTNYNDPRISVAWCKRNEVKIEKVFPKTLQSKFIWAMYEDPSFQF